MPHSRRTPRGWRKVHLKDVVSVRNVKFDPAQEPEVRYIALEHLASGAPRLLGWGSSAEATSAKARFRAGDLLYGKLRPRLRKAVPAPFDGVCSTDILPLHTRDGLEPRYLVHLAHWPPFENHAISTSIGTKMPRTSWEALGNFQLTIPPPGEQAAIAEVLDSIDSAIEKTEAVIVATEEARSALLQELLTRGMPGRHDAWKEVQGVGTMPDCWEVAKLGDVSEELRYGTSARCGIEPEGIPVLRIPNVASGVIDTSDLKYAELPHEEERRLRLRDGDLLVVRTNGNPNVCGRFAPFRELPGRWSFASYLIRIRVLPEEVLPDFISHFLNSLGGRTQLRGRIRTSAGNYNVSASDLASVFIAKPTLPEQEEIVDLIRNIDDRVMADQAVQSNVRRLKVATSSALLSGRLRVPDGVLSRRQRKHNG